MFKVVSGFHYSVVLEKRHLGSFIHVSSRKSAAGQGYEESSESIKFARKPDSGFPRFARIFKNWEATGKDRGQQRANAKIAIL